MYKDKISSIQHSKVKSFWQNYHFLSIGRAYAFTIGRRNILSSPIYFFRGRSPYATAYTPSFQLLFVCLYSRPHREVGTKVRTPHGASPRKGQIELPVVDLCFACKSLSPHRPLLYKGGANAALCHISRVYHVTIPGVYHESLSRRSPSSFTPPIFLSPSRD